MADEEYEFEGRVAGDVVMSNSGASRADEVPIAVDTQSEDLPLVPASRASKKRMPKPVQTGLMTYNMQDVEITFFNEVTGQKEKKTVQILSTEMTKYHQRIAQIKQDQHAQLFCNTAGLIHKAQTLEDEMRVKARAMVHFAITGDLDPVGAADIIFQALEERHNTDHTIERFNTYRARIQDGQRLEDDEIRENLALEKKRGSISVQCSKALSKFKILYNEELESYNSSLVPAEIVLEQNEDGDWAEEGHEVDPTGTRALPSGNVGLPSGNAQSPPRKALPLRPTDEGDPRNWPRGHRTAGLKPFKLTAAQQATAAARKQKRGGARKDDPPADESGPGIREAFEAKQDAEKHRRRVNKEKRKLRNQKEKEENKKAKAQAATELQAECEAEEEEAKSRATAMPAPVTKSPKTARFAKSDAPSLIQPEETLGHLTLEGTRAVSGTPSSVMSHEARAVPDAVKGRLVGMVKGIPADGRPYVASGVHDGERPGTWEINVVYRPAPGEVIDLNSEPETPTESQVADPKGTPLSPSNRERGEEDDEEDEWEALMPVFPAGSQPPRSAAEENLEDTDDESPAALVDVAPAGPAKRPRSPGSESEERPEPPTLRSTD
jgi:hypothetical protein